MLITEFTLVFPMCNFIIVGYVPNTFQTINFITFLQNPVRQVALSQLI